MAHELKRRNGAKDLGNSVTILSKQMRAFIHDKDTSAEILQGSNDIHFNAEMKLKTIAHSTCKTHYNTLVRLKACGTITTKGPAGSAALKPSMRPTLDVKLCQDSWRQSATTAQTSALKYFDFEFGYSSHKDS